MTTDAPTTLWDTDLLLQLAAQRHGLLEQLHALGRRQLELIEQGDMTRLMQVLSAKHHLLAEAQQVEKRLDVYRGQDPDARRWRPGPSRDECAELIGKADRLLRDVLEQEKAGEARLRWRRDEMAARLQVAHSASQARTAYAGPAAPAGRLDLCTEQ